MASRAGTSRVLAKLETCLENSAYYEAHQMYRTLYFRYSSQKRYDEALSFLYDGSVRLLTHGQKTSAADLILLAIDTLEKTEEVDVNLWISRLGDLIQKIGPDVVERETIIVKAIRWAGVKNASVKLHRLIATTLWNEGNLEQAKQHWLLSKNAFEFAKMLVQLSAKGAKSETDLFIAQVVLQQLCLKEKTIALETFQIYVRYHPKIASNEPPFDSPLLNFIYFLLKAIETGQLAMFKALCDLYQPSIQRDPSYSAYLGKVGVIFFGAPLPRQQGGSGIFGDFFNQLFAGFDDDEDGTTSQAIRGSGSSRDQEVADLD